MVRLEGRRVLEIGETSEVYIYGRRIKGMVRIGFATSLVLDEFRRWRDTKLTKFIWVARLRNGMFKVRMIIIDDFI